MASLRVKTGLVLLFRKLERAEEDEKPGGGSHSVPLLDGQAGLMDDDLAKQRDGNISSSMQMDRREPTSVRMAKVMGAAFDPDNLKSGFQESPKDLLILQRHKPLLHPSRRQRLVFQLERQVDPLARGITGWDRLALFGEQIEEPLSKHLETFKRLLDGAAEIRGIVQRRQRDHNCLGLRIGFEFDPIGIYHSEHEHNMSTHSRQDNREFRHSGDRYCNAEVGSWKAEDQKMWRRCHEAI